MRCSSCMAVNPVVNRFCGACGARLAAGPAAAPWGELKQATVLFADIVSSTEHIASLDPEEAMERLQPAMRKMCEAVEAFGGTVVRMLGDGIMAMFGVPLALEGHARLACEAALAMQKTFRETERGWRIRIGLHSGQIAWDPANADGVRGGGVHGLTIHLANRVMAAAEPGAIWLTQACLNQIRPVCEVQPRGSHVMKGIAEPVAAYRLVGMSAPADGMRAHSPGLTSLRGRGPEMAALRDALRLTSQGDAQVVAISGLPGAGKSRVCFEFAQECRAAGTPLFEVRTQLYGRATPLQPVLELLRTFFFEIPPAADATMVRASIAERLYELGSAEAEDLPLLYEFLGVAQPDDAALHLSPKGRHTRLLALVRELCKRRTSALAVLVIEDLHWLDEASQDFVATLVDAVAGTRTLLVLNYRPQYQPPWPPAAHLRILGLPELGDGDIEAMVSELTGHRPQLREICRMVARRSAGNPFFAEELGRSLVQGDLLLEDVVSPEQLQEIERALPSTVQAVLAARIDHLSDAEKALLQMCAIIGKEVPLAVLERVAGSAVSTLEPVLAGLRQAALLQPRPSSGAAERIAFRHPLIQEVAYSTQLKSRRGPIHAAVASAMEVHYEDRLYEYAGLVGYHFEAAGHMEDAAKYQTRAARWVGVTNSAQAIWHWRKVRELLHGQPRAAHLDSMRAMAGGQIGILGWRQGLPLTELQSIISEAVELAGEADSRLLQLLYIVEGRMLVGCGGAIDEHIMRTRKALALSTASDTGRAATIHAVLCQAYGWAGLLREALDANDYALAHVGNIDAADREFVGFSIEHWLWGLRSRTLIRLGRLEEAELALRAMLANGRDALDPAVQIIAFLAEVELAACRDDAEVVDRNAQAAMSLADRHGMRYLRVFAMGNFALARMFSGNAAAAMRDLREALVLIRESNVAMEYEAEVLAGLAECHLQLGEHALSLGVAREACALSRARSTRLPLCRALIAEGRAHLALGGQASAGEAEACFAQAETLIQVTGANIYRAVLARAREHAARLTITGSAAYQE